MIKVLTAGKWSMALSCLKKAINKFLLDVVIQNDKIPKRVNLESVHKLCHTRVSSVSCDKLQDH